MNTYTQVIQRYCYLLVRAVTHWLFAQGKRQSFHTLAVGGLGVIWIAALHAATQMVSQTGKEITTELFYTQTETAMSVFWTAVLAIGVIWVIGFAGLVVITSKVFRFDRQTRSVWQCFRDSYLDGFMGVLTLLFVSAYSGVWASFLYQTLSGSISLSAPSVIGQSISLLVVGFVAMACADVAFWLVFTDRSQSTTQNRSTTTAPTE